MLFAALAAGTAPGQRPPAPRVVFLVGESEYGAAETVPAFAREVESELGLRTAVSASRAREVPALDALADADLLVLFLRFREASDAQIETLDAWLEAGRPAVALRTTSHAFAGRNGWFPPRFGGHYKGHAPNDDGTLVCIAPDAVEHPILARLPGLFDAGYGGVYHAQPLADGAVPLLFGRSKGAPCEPVAWTYASRSGSRRFYTSLGTRANFEREEFRRLLKNAVLWALGRDVPGWVPRLRPTVEPPPPPASATPPGATVLFDGGDASAAWRHWDASAMPHAIEIDHRADTSSDARANTAPRWSVVDGALVGRPGFGDLLTRETFGNYELHVEFLLPTEPEEVAPRFRGRGGVYLGGRWEIEIGDTRARPLDVWSCGAIAGLRAPDVDAARPPGVWQTLDVRFRLERERAPVVSVWLNGAQVHDAVTLTSPTLGAFLEPLPGERSADAIDGLLHAWEPAESPDLGAGRFAFAARFRTHGNGTLVARAPRAGPWKPNGKTLFLRGGRLVYDIGWVGAMTSEQRYADGSWHDVVLTHDGDTALMFVDGELAARRAGFTAPDAPDHVLKVGATSPNFGGAFAGDIAEVRVFTESVIPEVARRLSRGESSAAPAPAITWRPPERAESATDDDGDPDVVRGPIRLQADGSAVRFANVWVRPLDDVDHAAIIGGWDAAALERGRAIYQGMCFACHGIDGTKPTNPQARPFATGQLENGHDPLSLFRTLSDGFRTMPPQTWMTPEQRYDVVHYIREAFLRNKNPAFYSAVDDEYLASLPAPLPAGVRYATDDGQLDRDWGPALASQLGSAVSSALSVRLPGDVTLSYDLHRMALAGAWRGGFLELGETQHYKQRGEGRAVPGGEPLPGLAAWEWAFDDGGFGTPAAKPPRGPVPPPQYRYRGHYLHDRELLLSYAIHDRSILERPSAVAAGERLAIVHALDVDGGDAPLRLCVARLPKASAEGWRVRAPFGAGLPVAGDGPAKDCVAVAGTARAGELGAFVAASTSGDVEGLRWEIRDDGRVVLLFPADSQRRRVQIARAFGRGLEDLTGFRGVCAHAASGPTADLRAKLHGGPLRWPQVLTTRGELGGDDRAYTVDTLSLPASNPWKAWLRTSALDFFSDGRCALATLGGDVWIVSGIDDDLDELRWKRYAAGMFEPLGLRVIDDVVYVTCRDRIVRLHDHDGDGEADFYESFFGDPDVTTTFHAFNFDLQTDREGNLYYAKSGRYTEFSIPGAVVKVSPDGSRHEFLATGFRTPNGMGMLPDGSPLVSDNQGNWVPASKISRIRPGGFYGVFQTAKQERQDFDRPILWLPQELDSSSGGQLWVDDPRWGPLSGRLLHTSFGKGWLYALTLQDVDDVTQAAAVRFPFQFDAGIMRARVNPADGQVYVTGLSGWQGPKDGADGCLQRVRYTGSSRPRVLDAFVRSDGLELRFTGPLDSEAARDPARYTLEQWNYRWTAAYGSPHVSARDPEREEPDRVAIDSVALDDDGTTVRLGVPGLRPVDQLRVRFEVPSRDGSVLRDTVYYTIHGVPD